MIPLNLPPFAVTCAFGEPGCVWEGDQVSADIVLPAHIILKSYVIDAFQHICQVEVHKMGREFTQVSVAHVGL